MVGLIKLILGAYRSLNLTYCDTIRKHERALILGNGPSTKQDLLKYTSLKMTDVWCVNGFALSDEFEDIQPCNYVLADPAYWSENNFPELNNYVKEVLSNIQSKTNWMMTLHLPLAARKTDVQKLLKNKFISFRYFNTTQFFCSCSKFRNWVYKNELAMPAPQNVLIAAIYLAILTRYSKIEILGADHSWHKDIKVMNSTLMLSDRHFYDDKARWKPFCKSDGSVWRISEIFATWSLVHQQYDLLDKFAMSFGIEIVNRTSNSFIDAFNADPLVGEQGGCI